MNLFIVILIAISLSMDAFSLALSFGTLKIPKSKCLFIALTVGIFHFFMPVLGTILGNIFVKAIHIDVSFLEAIIFFYIAILMFKDFKNDEVESLNLSLIGVLVFSLGVSLDSFGIGFAMNYGIISTMKCSLIFALCSFLFTFTGLSLGRCLNKLIGEFSILFGSIIMGILAILNICHFIF